MKHEYKYTGGLQHDDPWDKPRSIKIYSRQKFKQDTIDEVEDLWIDVVYTPHYNMGDISSLYCDMGKPFYCFPDYNDNGWEYCE